MILFFLLFGANSAAQELVGPARTVPGTLATFEIVPTQEASWHVVTPGTESTPYQIDTGLSKLYFASSEQGRYTVIAGIVDEGRPKFLVKAVVNGDEGFKPTPPPPDSTSTLEAWIRTQTPLLVKGGDWIAESRLVADCFEQIVRRIDEKSIQTPQNTQAQLQIALVAALALASPTAVTDWMPFLTELSRQLENELGDKITDLEELKKTLQTVADAMKSLEIPKIVTNTPLQVDTPRRQVRPFRHLFSQ